MLPGQAPTVPSGRAAMVSHPKEAVDLISLAAESSGAKDIRKTA